MKLVWFLMIVFVQKSLQDDENTTVVEVRRRLVNDIYRLDNASGHEVCNEDSKVVYLVDDRQCVTEKELLKECSSAIIPINSRWLFAAASISASMVKFEAMFHFREANQTINSSVCDIASLEVYRGVKQAIQISHQGFTLSENGSIKINYSEVAYTDNDYAGELYRMNLSCSDQGLPESGCLFVKMAGATNITHAKFNCTVPGTVADFDKECNDTPTTDTKSVTTSPITTSSKTTMATSSLSPTTSGFEVGGTYFLIVVICGVAVVTLLVGIVLVCFMVCLLRRKIRPNSGQTAPLGEDGCKQDSSLQDLETKQLDGRYHTPTVQEYETVIGNGGTPGAENHIYAALETPKNPRHYTDPIKINPHKKLNEHPNNSVPERQCQGHVPTGAPQYENPNNVQEASNKPQLVLAKGFSGDVDVSEHKYAVLERQPLTLDQRQDSLTQGEGEGHHYDAPPREDENSLRPHSSDKQHNDDDPASHEYAILEKL